MSFEDIPNWFYYIFISPIAYCAAKVVKFESRISTLENTDSFYKDDLSQLCANQRKLIEKVNKIEGMIETMLNEKFKTF